MRKLRIGVFDSGVGGESVVKAIKKALPETEVVFADDKQHVPYGNKSPEEIQSYVEPILNGLVREGCQAIVIACNTVTTTLIARLRQKISIPLVGMEPMVKTATEMTRSNVIAVCATPATLASERYKWLKDTYAKGVEVLEPDCSDWSYMIEHKEVDEDKIRGRIEAVCEKGADVIVLGCTHYHWIEELINRIADNHAQVIQPEGPVIEQLKKVLGRTS